MNYEERTKAWNSLAKSMIMLDMLQVELCEDTPYEVPSAAECRRRILAAMGYLQVVHDVLEKQF